MFIGIQCTRFFSFLEDGSITNLFSLQPLLRCVSALFFRFIFGGSRPILDYRTLCVKDDPNGYDVEYRYGLPHTVRMNRCASQDGTGVAEKDKDQ